MDEIGKWTNIIEYHSACFHEQEEHGPDVRSINSSGEMNGLAAKNKDYDKAVIKNESMIRGHEKNNLDLQQHARMTLASNLER